MVKILDLNGNPIDRQVLSDPQTSKLSGLHHEFAGHPSRGLTPARLARIMAGAEQGDLGAQCDLFDDMEEKDGHIYAEMSKRKRALLTVDWDIKPPRNASKKEQDDAAYAKEVIGDIANLEDVMLDALDAIGKGFACQEIEWQMLGREWMPKEISLRPQSWFQVNQADRNTLRLRDSSALGQALIPFGWITHVHKAKSGYLARSGLHRVLAWPFLFKNYAARDLAEFLEIYGLPLRLGTYPSGASKDEKSTLLSAVVNIGHDAAGIIPEGMMIDFKEAAKGSHEPFVAMMDWCERTQSKAILGGTLTSQADGKSSTNALGNVHNEVRHDLKVSDATQLGSTLTRDLVYPVIAVNRGGITDLRRLPKFTFDVREVEDFTAMAEALPKLVGIGVQVPQSYVHDKLRIPVPQECEAVLGIVQAPAPAQGAEAKPAAARALLAALSTALNNDPAPDAIDQLAASLAGDWREVVEPMADPIQAALNDAIAKGETAEQFVARLPGLLEKMSIEQLTERLARSAFAARLLGEAGIELD